MAGEVADWMNREEVQNIGWNFTLFPGQTFKDHFGGALLQYAQGNMNWEDLVSQVVEDWKTQSASR